MAGEPAASAKPLPNGWVKLKVSKLIGEGWLEIGDGYRAKNSEMGRIGLPFVRAGDVNGRVNTIGADLLGEASLAYVGNKRSQPGDAVITTKGTIGRMAFVRADDPTFIYSPQLCFWRSLEPNKVDPHWLYYALHSQEMRHQMSWSAAQTDMAPYISLSDQRSVFEITLPLIGDQLAIANVLASLDQKIDLNRQMAATLEDMARALFKSWFVDFDPVHSKAEGRDAGLPADIAKLFPDKFNNQDLPDGWTDEPLLSFADLISGGTPKTYNADYWNGTIPWASAKDVSQCGQLFLEITERTITEQGLDESSTKIVPANTTVVVARGATTGRNCIFGIDMAMNQTCYALKSHEGFDFWFNLCFRNEIERIVASAHGSAFDTITTVTLENARIIPASENIRRVFEQQVSPLFQRVLALTTEAKQLQGMRDFLLPKLLSGELQVADAETVIAAA